jgi:hypothetical protein
MDRHARRTLLRTLAISDVLAPGSGPVTSSEVGRTEGIPS